MVIKWEDKKDVTMISAFHDDTLRTLRKRGVEVKKLVCVLEYNQQMGGVDLKDQKFQTYLLERKGVKVVHEIVQTTSERDGSQYSHCVQQQSEPNI
jgi:hypothetical protein